jgi:crotonobetainyl-CoA:carnitine CoA-transferase CaiB-like acyl-CoA transferase
LIYAHITGYGTCGDDVDEPGYDLTAYWARSGLMFTMHNADDEPCRAPTGFGDHPTAMSLFAAIMLALYRREVSGQGSKVSTSLLANGAWSNASMIQAAQLGAKFLPRTSRKTVANPMVNHYVTRDQKRFITCCLDPQKDWPNFCRALSRPELIDDERFRTPQLRHANSVALVEIIDQVVATKTLAEWDRILRSYGLTWTRVQSNQEVAADPQMEANGVFDEIAPGMPTVSSPFQVEGVSKVKPRMAPQVGEHTREVLQSLGYEQAEIAAMLERGAARAKD